MRSGGNSLYIFRILFAEFISKSVILKKKRKGEKNAKARYIYFLFSLIFCNRLDLIILQGKFTMWNCIRLYLKTMIVSWNPLGIPESTLQELIKALRGYRFYPRGQNEV
jgi:hypothetical protein